MSTPPTTEYISSNADRFLDELKALVSIPSISTLSDHHPDSRRAAQFLVDQLQEHVGLSTARLIETDGLPLVYAEWLEAPGKPTVLLYGHYDVQPVDPIELWRTPPFAPTIEGEYLVGRGTADDKGPMFAIIKALEALMAAHSRLPVNIKVLIEGEEESGGESIEAYVKTHIEQLQADCVLILDTVMEEKGTPTLCYGLRGIAYMEISAQGAPQDLHSGLYGGVAPNPIQALAWILADLKGRDGHINLPGLHELMRPVTDQERAQMERQSEASAKRLMDATGLQVLPGEEGYSVVERASARPTFEVHGIRGGFIGEGAKTVIPALATAKVSLRLVEGQQPDQVFRLLQQRVKELTPPGVSTSVQFLHGGDAVGTPPDHPILQAAAEAMAQELGRPTEFIRMGASIPVAALFGSLLKLPLVMMGFALPDDNFHAPNEHFYLPNYYTAIRSVASFLQRLGGN